MSEIYLSGEPCPICKKDWWDESCEHTWIDVNREFDTLRKQLDDARYEANLANRGFETIEKQDTALRAQHVAEMDAKVEALEWRDREICTLRTKLDIAADKITVTLTHLREFDNVSHYHYCIDLAKITLDNALAEIEKVGKDE